MQIVMECSKAAGGLSLRKWDVGILGPVLDERGKTAADFVRATAKKIITIRYVATELHIATDSGTVEADEVFGLICGSADKSVVLESSTLGFVETYLCCRALREGGGTGVSIVYLEPMKYSVSQRQNVVHRRDFGLSDEVAGYQAIPGSSFELDERKPQRCVFCVGFEGQRLEQAFEELPINPKRAGVIFGVPAFRPGWEIDTFANNARTIRERALGGGVFFCGANNPKAVLETLEKIYRDKSPAEQMFVGAIGTKPHGIGVALFACEYADVGLLYDHPTRSNKRSENYGAWHLFDVKF